jgi:hypothetical protein
MSQSKRIATVTVQDLPEQELTHAQEAAVKGGIFFERTTDIVDPLEGELLGHGVDPDGNEDINGSGPGLPANP